jgi:hypothetical protein
MLSEISLTLQDELLADIEFRRTKNLHTTISDIRYIQYNMPIQNETALSSMQERFRRIAPEMLIRDLWNVQELGNAYGVPWYEERGSYADRAIEMLLNREVGTSESTDYITLTELQEKYKLPVTPERRRKLLRDFPVHDSQYGKRYATCFELTPDELRPIAAAWATKNMEGEAKTRSPDSGVFHDPKYTAAWYVHETMQMYDVPVRDIPQLSEAAIRAKYRFERAHSVDECVSSMSELANDLKRTMDAKSYLPEIFGEITHGVIQGSSTLDLQKLKAVLGDEFKPIFMAHLELHFAECNLNVNDPEKAALLHEFWKKKARQPDSQEKAESVMKAHGLPLGVLLEAWSHASDDSNRTYSGGGKHRDLIGSDIIIANNMVRIQELESRTPGASRQLYEAWGICNFGRYPASVLSGQYMADMREKELPKDKREKMKNVIMVNPYGDWNGAFSDESYMINHLNKQMVNGGYRFRICECGKNIGAARRLMEFNRRYGPIDVAVIGAHSSGDKIWFGPQDQESFNLRGAQKGDPQQVAKIELIRACFSDDGHIIFRSCSVGKPGGLASETHELFEIDTHGPLVPSSLRSISLGNPAESQWTSGGQPAPSASYERPKPPKPPEKKTWFGGWLRR